MEGEQIIEGLEGSSSYFDGIKLSVNNLQDVRLLVKIIEYGGERSENKRIVKRLRSDKYCIFIVTDGNSKLSKNTIEILGMINNPPGLIMPSSTDPSVLAFAESCGYSSCLTLPPDEHFQAKCVTKYINNTLPEHEFILLGDSDFTDYSERMLSNLSKKLLKYKLAVIDLNLIGKNMLIENTSLMKLPGNNKKTCVVYVGSNRNAILLAKKILNFKTKNDIIFSIGCEAIHLTPEDIDKLEEINFSFGSYSAYAKDSVSLIKEILKHCEKIERSDIRETLEKKRGLLGFYGDKGKYFFDEHRKNVQASFYIKNYIKEAD